MHDFRSRNAVYIEPLIIKKYGVQTNFFLSHVFFFITHCIHFNHYFALLCRAVRSSAQFLQFFFYKHVRGKLPKNAIAKLN